MTVRNDKTAKNTGSGEPVTADDAAGSRAPAFVRRSRPLHLAWQVAIFLAGVAVVVLGVIMLPLPGPGWVVIFLGMGVWATEFDWARLVLRWSRRKVAEAAQRALDPRVRRRNLTVTAIGLAAAVGIGGWYFARYGLDVPWTAGES